MGLIKNKMKVLSVALTAVFLPSFVSSFIANAGLSRGVAFQMPQSSIRSEKSAASTMSLLSTTTSEDIIPREVLFGNPNYASPMLSPDGEYLAFLAPSTDKGVLNVFVQKTSDIENIENARMVTNDQSRGIRQAGWSPDSTTILFLQDFEGDENFHLWSIDASAEEVEAKDLTPGKDVKASNLLVNKRFKDEILVGTNERDATCFDIVSTTRRVKGLWIRKILEMSLAGAVRMNHLR